MAELSVEQQRAIAEAMARKAKAEAAGGTTPIVNDNPMRAEMPPGMSEAGGDAPYTPSSVPWLDPINALGTSFAENIPVIGKPLSDFGNKVDAAFASAVEGKPVTPEERAAITEAEQRKFPAASVTGAVAGNVLPLAPLAATRLGAAAFGLSGPLLARVGLGGATGGLLSAADAASEGADFNQAVDAGLWGAGFGAAGGAAAPYVEDLLSALGRRAGLRSSQAADNLSRPTRDTMLRVLEADGALGPGGQAAVRQGGQGAMLVDASPSAVGVLDTALQRGGPGASTARAAIESRAANANTSINQALDEALGAPQGVTATETAIRQGSAPARQAAYDAAYARPIDYSSEAGMAAEDMLSRVPQGVIGLANRMMQLEGQQSRQILARVGADGTITYLRMPDVRQIDYITRALQQAARSGEGAGALGGQTDIGRAYGMLARELRDAVRSAVPEYDQALRTAATPIQQREGLRFGEGLLGPQVTRDEAREIVDGMTGPQLAAARQGLRSHIDDVLANVRAVVSDPNIDAREASTALRNLSSRAAREKIRMVMPSEADANRLFAQLAQASRALELRAGVATNSRTYGRLAAQTAVDDAIRGGPINGLLRGEPINATRSVVQSVTGRTPAGERSMSDRVFGELADTLTLSGDDALAMLSSLAYRSRNPRAQAPFLPGLAQAGADYGIPITSRP